MRDKRTPKDVCGEARVGGADIKCNGPFFSYFEKIAHMSVV